MTAMSWGSAMLVCFVTSLAAAETIHTDSVTVDFDRAGFSFDRYDGVSVVPIAPESVTIQAMTNGIELRFNDQLIVSDAAMGESDPLLATTGNYHAGFSFTPDAGLSISGYRVTLFGSYEVEFPGQASIATESHSYGFLSGPNGTFSETYETPGPIAPPLTGTLSTLGDISFTEVAVGAQSVYVRSDYVADPNCPDPDPSFCPLIEVPIYEEVTVYELQADLGSAGINLQGIRLEAILVPEPASARLLLWALLWVFGRTRLSVSREI